MKPLITPRVAEAGRARIITDPARSNWLPMEHAQRRVPRNVQRVAADAPDERQCAKRSHRAGQIPVVPSPTWSLM